MSCTFFHFKFVAQCYLGSWLTSDARCEKEIRRRTNLAKSSFNSMRNIFIDRMLSIHLKTRLLKCIVWSVLMFECETRTLAANIRKNIEAAEMLFYLRILRIPWTALQTNEAVLQKMGQERKLLCCIKQRQLKFLVHVIRNGELENLVLRSRISVKGARGAQRFTFTNNFNHLYQNPGQLWDATQNRTNWKNILVHRGLEQP